MALDLPTPELITRASAALSALGAAYIVATFILLPELRNQARLCLVYLSLADLVRGCVVAFLPNSNGLLCDIQGFIQIAAAQVSLAWTLCLSAFVLLTFLVAANSNLDNSQRQSILNKFIVFCHFFAFLLPTTPFLVLAARNEHISKQPNGYCSFRNVETTLAYFWVPTVAMLIISMILLAITLYRTRQLRSSPLSATFVRLSFVPLVLLLRSNVCICALS